MSRLVAAGSWTDRFAARESLIAEQAAPNDSQMQPTLTPAATEDAIRLLDGRGSGLTSPEFI